MKCKIRWISLQTGLPTPDENEAVGFVRREAHTAYFRDALCDQIEYPQSEWMPICAEHLKRVSTLEHWSFKLIYEVSP